MRNSIFTEVGLELVQSVLSGYEIWHLPSSFWSQNHEVWEDCIFQTLEVSGTHVHQSPCLEPGIAHRRKKTKILKGQRTFCKKVQKYYNVNKIRKFALGLCHLMYDISSTWLPKLEIKRESNRHAKVNNKKNQKTSSICNKLWVTKGY